MLAYQRKSTADKPISGRPIRAELYQTMNTIEMGFNYRLGSLMRLWTGSLERLKGKCSNTKENF